MFSYYCMKPAHKNTKTGSNQCGFESIFDENELDKAKQVRCMNIKNHIQSRNTS